MPRSELVARELLAGGGVEDHQPVAGPRRRYRRGGRDASARQHFDGVCIGDAGKERGAAGLAIHQGHAAAGRRDEDPAAAIDRLAVVGGAKQGVHVRGNLGTVSGAPGPDLAVGRSRTAAERQDEDFVPPAHDELGLSGRLSRRADRRPSGQRERQQRHQRVSTSQSHAPEILSRRPATIRRCSLSRCIRVHGAAALRAGTTTRRHDDNDVENATGHVGT